MKRYNIFCLLMLAVSLFTGCKEDNIVFDIEQPRFPLRDGYELLEVIAPYGTSQTDQIYIVGDFNGGLEEAVGNPMWLLEKAPDTNVSVDKWGIYLNPSDFVDGKTLADGYYFYNIQEGEERSLDNQPVVHTEHPGVGKRMNVVVNFWEESFNKPVGPGEVVHDGYAIYVIDDTGYLDLYLYAWGDGEIFGAWPGIPVTGRTEINGVTYKYFDTGAANEGMNVNLIFNNGNGGAGNQFDGPNVTLDKDFYYQLTDSEAIEIDPNSSIEHDGYTVYIYNNSGWDTVYLYMWGDVNDLNGAWPGMLPTGTIVINGVGYLYYDLGEANTGLNENLIFNNGAGVQFDGPNIDISADYYYEITSSKATAIDPETFSPTPGEGGDDQPEEPQPNETYNLYVENQTGWNPLYLYSYNSAGTQFEGAWPGLSSTTTQEIAGVIYTVFNVKSDNGTVNLIFNDGTGGEGHQLGDYSLILDKDYYLKATPTGVSEVGVPQFHLYIDNQTGWDKFYVYAWSTGNPEIFGGWPGQSSTVTETIDGIDYLVYNIPANGLTYNLIFTNNDGVTQYDAAIIDLDKDYYITANPGSATIKQ